MEALPMKLMCVRADLQTARDNFWRSVTECRDVDIDALDDRITSLEFIEKHLCKHNGGKTMLVLDQDQARKKVNQSVKIRLILLGMTLTDLAKANDVSRTTLQKRLQGTVTQYQLDCWSELLRVPANAFLKPEKIGEYSLQE